MMARAFAATASKVAARRFTCELRRGQPVAAKLIETSDAFTDSEQKRLMADIAAIKRT